MQLRGERCCRGGVVYNRDVGGMDLKEIENFFDGIFRCDVLYGA